MKQIVHGFDDMMSVLVTHRDLKLQNVMLHFPNDDYLSNLSKSEKLSWLRDVDLNKTFFEIKIADFGFSKKLK